MSSTILTKSIAGAGLAGGIAGGSYLASPYLLPKKEESPNTTIEDHINSLKLKLISSLEQSKVAKQWEEEYKLDEANIKASMPEASTWEKFKEWCGTSLQLKKSEHESLVSKVQKWCTIGTIEDRISRKSGKSLISEEGATDDWEKIYTTNNQSADRTALGLEGSPNNTKKQSDIDAIKAFCKQEKKKDFLAENKESSFDRVEKWCTKTS
ncbi:hypothetical protein MHF_1363 [Mycoplasma haemofelis Ohio2]|uniref:Uncharacterized protein n=1 Tax=Mycoplasma haemofelis (strain Ohio2) TaxID=859194 RepID=F6FGA1_MYCHI|nr:hypothetical protein MHF_1363 [Mycoplasma haemofelis Ohio2]